MVLTLTAGLGVVSLMKLSRGPRDHGGHGGKLDGRDQSLHDMRFAAADGAAHGIAMIMPKSADDATNRLTLLTSDGRFQGKRGGLYPTITGPEEKSVIARDIASTTDEFAKGTARSE